MLVLVTLLCLGAVEELPDTPPESTLSGDSTVELEPVERAPPMSAASSAVVAGCLVLAGSSSVGALLLAVLLAPLMLPVVPILAGVAGAVAVWAGAARVGQRRVPLKALLAGVVAANMAVTVLVLAAMAAWGLAFLGGLVLQASGDARLGAVALGILWTTEAAAYAAPLWVPAMYAAYLAASVVAGAGVLAVIVMGLGRPVASDEKPLGWWDGDTRPPAVIPPP